MSNSRIEHKWYTFPEDSEPDNGWFYKHGVSSVLVLFAQSDIEMSRKLAANMLAEAWNSERFFLENGGMNPEPDELDRMRQIAWIQYLASSTGLLNGEEILEIQEKEGLVSPYQYHILDRRQPSFQEMSLQTSEWKSKGLKIGLFHGSFDPVTVTHCACATSAYAQCDRLIIGFDNDYLLKQRKGDNRPRFPLDWRRKRFGGLWMVDGTVILNANDVEDVDQYIIDYKALNLDYVFLAQDQRHLDKRLFKIKSAGAQPIFLHHFEDELSATRLLKDLEYLRSVI